MKIKFYTNKGREIIKDFDLQGEERFVAADRKESDIINSCPFKRPNPKCEPWCTYPDGKKKYFPADRDSAWSQPTEVTCDWNANNGDIIPGTNIEMTGGCPRLVYFDCGVEVVEKPPTPS